MDSKHLIATAVVGDRKIISNVSFGTAEDLLSNADVYLRSLLTALQREAGDVVIPITDVTFSEYTFPNKETNA